MFCIFFSNTKEICYTGLDFAAKRGMFIKTVNVFYGLDLYNNDNYLLFTVTFFIDETKTFNSPILPTSLADDS